MKKFFVILPAIIFAISCSHPNGQDGKNTSYDYLATTAEEIKSLLANPPKIPFVMAIDDGVYEFNESIFITSNDIGVVGLSGNRDNVVLKGPGIDGTAMSLFLVHGSRFSIRNLSIGEAAYHGLDLHFGDEPVIENIRFFDTGLSLLRIATDSSGTDYCENGNVSDCLFELSTASGNDYIAGLEIQSGIDWTISGNRFIDIVNLGIPIATAILVWKGAVDPIIEGNQIVNCERGIAFGLGSTDEYGGIIRNNMIRVTNDAGISINRGIGTKVYNNTVSSDEDYFAAIEYRFTQTSADIRNNIVDTSIIPRDGASGIVQTNQEGTLANWFIDETAGDFHLTSGISGIVDSGTSLAEVPVDFDGDIRSTPCDIGADEF